MLARVFVPETCGVDRVGEPLLGGIPLPQGVLREGGWFRLVGAQGRAAVCEGTAAAFWPDGSVKWLHLCGIGDLAGGQRNAFDLEPSGPPPGQGLRVAREADMLRILEGDAAVEVGGAAVLSARSIRGLTAELTLTDPGHLRRLVGRWQPGIPRVVVEAANRAVVRLAGGFTADGPAQPCELILFIEVLRGVPEVRLQPVFIYMGLPERDLVHALTLTVRTALGGEDAAYAFAGEQGIGYSDSVKTFAETGPRWREARLLQLGSSFYRIDKRVTGADPWVKAAEGARSAGWCHLTGPRGGVTAAWRHFWQEYPHELHVEAQSGSITFGLWPASAQPLDFRRYSSTVFGRAVYETDTPGYEHIALRLDGRQWNPAFGALGIAKSHELMLRFHESTLKPVEVKYRDGVACLHVVDPACDVAARALRFANPCRPMPEPAHFAASGAVGRVAALAQPPPDDELATPSPEHVLFRVADFMVAERAVRGWYGQYDYGDIQMAFYSDLDRWSFDNGGYTWMNTECLPDYGLWLAALCAGRSDWLAAASDMTRHNRDVDMHHRGPCRGYGSRHNVNHWGCACKEWRISMPLVKRLHYYVTADPWTREVIDETTRLYESQPRTMRLAPDATAAFAAAYVKWELSGEARDGVVVARFMDGLAAGFTEDGRYVRTVYADVATGECRAVAAEAHETACFFNKFGGLHVLVEAAELLRHGPLQQALLRYARYQLAARLDAFLDLLPLLAFAWRQTGEPRFRQAIGEALGGVPAEAGSGGSGIVGFEERGGDGPLDAKRHTILAGLDGTNKIMCHPLAVILHSCPYGLAAAHAGGEDRAL